MKSQKTVIHCDECDATTTLRADRADLERLYELALSAGWDVFTNRGGPADDYRVVSHSYACPACTARAIQADRERNRQP
jgi:hypothetical protein